MSSYCDIQSLAVIDQRTLWDHSSQLESENPREDSGEAKLHSKYELTNLPKPQ